MNTTDDFALRALTTEEIVVLTSRPGLCSGRRVRMFLTRIGGPGWQFESQLNPLAYVATRQDLQAVDEGITLARLVRVGAS